MSLVNWYSNIKFIDEGWIAMNIDQLLLRGCELKNTEFVMGLVVYTGHETKVMLNGK